MRAFTIHKIWFGLLGFIFLIGIAITSWSQQYWIMVVPFLLMALGIFIRHPHYLLYILLISIPWSIEFNFTPELGTDLPDEPLMWVMALTAVMLLINHYKLLSQQRIHPLFFILGLQLAWLVITVIVSSDILASVKYLVAKCWYLMAFVAAPFILFINEKIFRRGIMCLMVSMLAFMVLALIRHAQFGLAFDRINDALVPFYRNHVNYSALLVFMVPVQIALIRLSTSERMKFAISCLLIIIIGALYFSYSRGAWLALLMGLFSLYIIKKGWLLFSFSFIMLLSLATIVYLGSTDRYLKFSNDKSTIFHPDIREHLIATYKLKDMSNGERVYRWVAGIRMIGDYWMTGSGPSTFVSEYKNYTIPSFRTYVSKNEDRSTVHNYFLLLIIEQGVIGLLLFLILLGALFWYIQKIYNRTTDYFWKVCMAATGAILVMVCTVNFLSDMIETDKVGSVFYLCVAVVLVAHGKTAQQNSKVKNQN